jgi:hypothetical protein
VSKRIRRFYLDAVNAAGFDTRDIGYGTLNAPAATYLGIAIYWRVNADLTITVTTRARSCLRGRYNAEVRQIPASCSSRRRSGPQFVALTFAELAIPRELHG